MPNRRLFVLLVAYLAFDFADPMLPGAFSFDVRDSEVEEAIHVQRRAAERRQLAGQSTPPEHRAGVSPSPVPADARAPRDVRPIPRVARSAPTFAARASAPEDH